MLKKIFIAFTLVAVLFLSSCGQGISADEAKNCAEAFYKCIEEENYPAAAELMHPDRGTTAEFLEEFFTNVEETVGVDFSNGIEAKYNGVSSSLYDSNVGGAYFELRGELTVDGYTFDLILEFVRIDGVFGMDNFQLDGQE